MYKTLKPSDSVWYFSPDGISMVPRAGFEISTGCPASYRQVIAECINRGWLSPVAFMRDPEYTMELLRK